MALPFDCIESGYLSLIEASDSRICQQGGMNLEERDIGTVIALNHLESVWRYNDIPSDVGDKRQSSGHLQYFHFDYFPTGDDYPLNPARSFGVLLCEMGDPGGGL